MRGSTSVKSKWKISIITPLQNGYHGKEKPLKTLTGWLGISSLQFSTMSWSITELLYRQLPRDTDDSCHFSTEFELVICKFISEVYPTTNLISLKVVIRADFFHYFEPETIWSDNAIIEYHMLQSSKVSAGFYWCLTDNQTMDTVRGPAAKGIADNGKSEDNFWLQMFRVQWRSCFTWHRVC